MRILLVSVDALLSEHVHRLLGGAHNIIDAAANPLVPAAVTAATAGADAVVVALPAASTSVEDDLLNASAGVYNYVRGAAHAGARLILLSSLRTFERYPLNYRVTEFWAPRPTTGIADLSAITAETVVRSCAQELALKAICLRLGTVSDGERPDPRAVHVADVVTALERALEFEPEPTEPATGWWVFHIVGAGRTRFSLGLASRDSVYPNGGRGSTLGFQPVRDVAGPDVATALAPSDEMVADLRAGVGPRVLILGAGGPFGALAARELVDDHVLRLTDMRPLADAVADPAQQPGAPTPRLYEAPHESRVVDVRDFQQVLDAAADVDVIINLTVVRSDPVEAFRVNTIGTYNVMRAAVQHGIRRVVMTGPNQVFNPMNGAYWSDFDLGSDVPQRPGSHLYMLSKFLGQEIARIFAEEGSLEVPNLVFGYFTDPATAHLDPLGSHPFMVSWHDTGTALRAAVTVPSFPRPYEVIHVQGEMPHGKYRNDRAKEVLGWVPRDDLSVLWLEPVS